MEMSIARQQYIFIEQIFVLFIDNRNPLNYTIQSLIQVHQFISTNIVIHYMNKDSLHRKFFISYNKDTRKTGLNFTLSKICTKAHSFLIEFPESSKTRWKFILGTLGSVRLPPYTVMTPDNYQNFQKHIYIDFFSFAQRGYKSDLTPKSLGQQTEFICRHTLCLKYKCLQKTRMTGKLMAFCRCAQEGDGVRMVPRAGVGSRKARRQNLVYVSYSNALSKDQKQCEEGKLSQTLPLFLLKTLTE